jgi:hypothetical protein
MECLTCKSNSGEQRISPGPTIYEGEYWFVEHAYPVKRLGWLVIVLKRHEEAEGFPHIHFHVFAKPADLPDELKGGKSFNLLKVSREEAVPPAEIISFCESFHNKFTQQAK